MAFIVWKEGERILKVAWVNFKELLAMAKQSTLALYATVMTVLSGTFLLLGILACYLWVTEVKQGQKDTKASGERHIRDLEEKLAYLDSAKISQYKLNAALEPRQPFLIHDTIKIIQKR